MYSVRRRECRRQWVCAWSRPAACEWNVIRENKKMESVVKIFKTQVLVIKILCTRWAARTSSAVPAQKCREGNRDERGVRRAISVAVFSCGRARRFGNDDFVVKRDWR